MSTRQNQFAEVEDFAFQFKMQLFLTVRERYAHIVNVLSKELPWKSS